MSLRAGLRAGTRRMSLRRGQAAQAKPQGGPGRISLRVGRAVFIFTSSMPQHIVEKVYFYKYCTVHIFVHVMSNCSNYLKLLQIQYQSDTIVMEYCGLMNPRRTLFS